MERKHLLFAGILAPIVFLLNDIIGGIVTPNYDYIVHAVSELTQTGSLYSLGPFLFLISAIFSLVFGIVLFLEYKDMRSKLLLIGSILIIIMAISNGLTGTIFPMDPWGTEMTFPGTMHMVLVPINMMLLFPLILFFGIGLHREKQWKSFRSYSIFTVIIIFIFGGLTSISMMNYIGWLGLVAYQMRLPSQGRTADHRRLRAQLELPGSTFLMHDELVPG